MIAAQLFAAIVRDVPDVHVQIGRGEFEALNNWLGERIWSRASSRPARELLVEATGSELSPSFYREHLTRRYLGDG
jgi:carboxypeptidase Taq